MVWLRSAFFALLGPGTVLVGGPSWILTSTDQRIGLGPARWIGLPLLILGVSTLLWCIAEFAVKGRGSLAPVDEPRFVVRSGLYRYVRNPMYLSVFTTLTGETLLFRSPWLIAWALGFSLAFALLVVTYEEPHLRRRFGRSYEEYLRTVPRWVPRRPLS